MLLSLLNESTWTPYVILHMNYVRYDCVPMAWVYCNKCFKNATDNPSTDQQWHCTPPMHHVAHYQYFGSLTH